MKLLFILLLGLGFSQTKLETRQYIVTVNALTSNYIELNTTIMAKDDHRPCVPQPVDQRNSWPSSQHNNSNVVMYNDQETTYGVEDKFVVDGEQNWRNCTTVNQIN